ncbi:hypothetical protein C0J52_21601 [Blattella germanica]|nr:hypothetical protein C0J52_21601 [Blattella germanica]
MKITEFAFDKVQKYKTDWKTHINRMSGERLPKVTQEYRPSVTGNIGRPRKQWIDEAGTGFKPTP